MDVGYRLPPLFRVQRTHDEDQDDHIHDAWLKVTRNARRGREVPNGGFYRPDRGCFVQRVSLVGLSMRRVKDRSRDLPGPILQHAVNNRMQISAGRGSRSWRGEGTPSFRRRNLFLQ